MLKKLIMKKSPNVQNRIFGFRVRSFVSRAVYCLFIFLFISTVCQSQNKKIDSLRVLVKTMADDTAKANRLHDMSRQFYFLGQFDSIIQSAQAELQVAKKIDYKKGVINAYNIIGLAYYLKGNYPEALKNDYAALAICEEINDKERMALGLTNIGLIFRNKSDYPKALDCFLKALAINEENGNKPYIENSIGNIGTIYSEEKDFKKALEYYQRALKMTEESGDKVSMARHLANIGSIYTAEQDYPKALEYHLKALKMEEGAEDHTAVMYYLNNIGDDYYLSGDLSKALEYYFRSLQESKKYKEKNGIAIATGNIGSTYLKLNDLVKSKIYLDSAVVLNKELGNLIILKDVYKNKCSLDSASENYKGALENYKNYVTTLDSVNNEENARKQTRLEMQYDFDKKESQTKAEQDKKDTVTKIIIFSISGGLFLMLVLTLFIFKSYRQKRNANIIITRQKILVEEKQREILDSIHYARRIQRSLLPTEKYIERTLNKLKK